MDITKTVSMGAALLLVTMLTGCGQDTAPVQDAHRAITSYALGHAAGSSVGMIDETADPHSIKVAVPFGTDIRSLIAVFATTGANVKIGTTVQISGTTANDFTAATSYLVTASDGSTAIYSVRVSQAMFVDPLGTDDVMHGGGPGTLAFKTIQYALADNRLVAGSTLLIAAGTYAEVGQIVIARDVSLVGAGRANTVIRPAQDTGAVGDSRGWFLVNSGVNFDLSKVTLDGSGHLVYVGIYSWGAGTVDDCVFTEMRYYAAGPDYEGRGMVIRGSGTVLNSSFTQMGRIGIQFFGGSGTVFSNTFAGKGSGPWLDYGIELGAGAVVTILDNVVTNASGIVGTDESAGVLVTTYFGPGTTATIANNILLYNGIGIAVGYDAFDTSAVLADDNMIMDNIVGVLSTQPVVDARNNWWGDASGPNHPSQNALGIGNPVSDFVLFAPWLMAIPVDGSVALAKLL